MAYRPKRSHSSPFSHLATVRHAEEPDIYPPEKDSENDNPDENPDDDDKELGNENPDDRPPEKDPNDENLEDDEKEMDAEDEQDDEDDLKAEEEDDEDDQSVRKDAKARASSRCRAIFRRPEAAGNFPLACHLAFETNMSRKQAVAALRAAAAFGRSGRRGRQGSTTASLRSRMRRANIRPARSNATSQSSLVSRTNAFNKRNA